LVIGRASITTADNQTDFIIDILDDRKHVFYDRLLTAKCSRSKPQVSVFGTLGSRQKPLLFFNSLSKVSIDANRQCPAHANEMEAHGSEVVTT